MLTQDHATNRITCAERAEHTQSAARQVFLVFVQGDYRTGRTGVGVGVENYRCFTWLSIAAKQLACDQQVHVEVGLMQPEAFHIADVQLVLGQVRGNQLGNHRADILEYLAPFLDEQLVTRADALFRTAVEEAEVVADVVAELGDQLGADDIELVVRGGLIGTLDDHRRCSITEDKVAVAVTEVQVAGADFRVDHQDRAGLTQLHAVGRSLDTEGGGGTGHVHVITETLDAQCGLHFNRHGRVGALQVGASHDHPVDIGGSLAGTGHGVLGGAYGHFAEDAPVFIAALRQARRHARGIENAGLVHDKAALDARGFFDEATARLAQRFDFTAGNGRGVVGIELLDEGVERLDQLIVGNTVCRGIEAGTTDHDVMHSHSYCSSPQAAASYAIRPGQARPWAKKRLTGSANSIHETSCYEPWSLPQPGVLRPLSTSGTCNILRTMEAKMRTTSRKTHPAQCLDRRRCDLTRPGDR